MLSYAYRTGYNNLFQLCVYALPSYYLEARNAIFKITKTMTFKKTIYTISKSYKAYNKLRTLEIYEIAIFGSEIIFL